MLLAFLVSRPSYDHYLLVVLPLLLAGALTPGSAARDPWFRLALVPQVPGFTWPVPEPLTRRAFKDCLTLCVLTACVALRTAVAGSCVRVLTRPGKRGYSCSSLCVLACPFSRGGPYTGPPGPMTSDQHSVCVTEVRSGLS